MEITDNCVIIRTKYKNIDYLVAYVQTILSIENLRQYCMNHLPLYMVPPIFMILNGLCLNEHREIIDRDLLLPDFTCLPILSNINKPPSIEME